MGKAIFIHPNYTNQFSKKGRDFTTSFPSLIVTEIKEVLFVNLLLISKHSYVPVTALK